MQIGLRNVKPRSDLSERLRTGRVLPVVGASLSYELILAVKQEHLAQSWAEKLDLPRNEGDPACRIARYEYYRSGDDLQVKEGYLLFLKEALLKLAKSSGVGQDEIDEAARELDYVAFTEFARRLGYPNYDNDQYRNPLLLLANLPITTYLTTSFHGLLQTALLRAGREPRTAVCCWNDAAANLVRPEHRLDPDYRPTVQAPLVFHVYGHDEYPESLVLSEDDYLSFLESIAEDPWKDAQDRVMPGVVLDAWTSSSLLCLGFYPEALEFKTLWQGLELSSPDGPDRRGTFQCSDLPEQAVFRQYHEQYLTNRRLDVYWGTAVDLLRTLHER